MFWTTELISNAKFKKIWIAGTMPKKLQKKDVMSVNVVKYSNFINQQNVPFALRITGFLLYGLVIIYERQMKYLFFDANHILNRVNLRKLKEIDLEDTDIDTVTLPQRIAIELPFIDTSSIINDISQNELDLVFGHLQARPEDITLHEIGNNIDLLNSTNGEQLLTDDFVAINNENNTNINNECYNQNPIDNDICMNDGVNMIELQYHSASRDHAAPTETSERVKKRKFRLMIDEQTQIPYSKWQEVMNDTSVLLKKGPRERKQVQRTSLYSRPSTCPGMCTELKQLFSNFTETSASLIIKENNFDIPDREITMEDFPEIERPMSTPSHVPNSQNKSESQKEFEAMVARVSKTLDNSPHNRKSLVLPHDSDYSEFSLPEAETSQKNKDNKTSIDKNDYKMLKFMQTKIPNTGDKILFTDIVGSTSSRKIAAQAFFQILSLTGNGYIQSNQKKPYAPIAISQGQLFNA